MFRITAKAVIFVNGKVMVLRKHTGRWDLPGGRLNDGEEIEVCIARETVEEIGLGINVGPLIECNLRRLQDPRCSVIVVTYLCTLNGGYADIVLSSEHTEVQLFNDLEIDSLDMRTAYRKPVKKAFSQQAASPDAQNMPFNVELIRDGRSLLQTLKARLFWS
jgi:8-oxo-dGTP pyrophosphatase MutT (NUDIX family)